MCGSEEYDDTKLFGTDAPPSSRTGEHRELRAS
jgi:hypothetical protein